MRRDFELVAGFVAHHSCLFHPPDGFLEWAEMRRDESLTAGNFPYSNAHCSTSRRGRDR